MRELLLLIGLSLYPTWAIAAPPPAPQALSIISCRFDDHGAIETSAEGVHHTGARDWRPHMDKNGEVECRREVSELQDAVAALDPSVKPLASNFGDHTQCVHAAVMFTGPEWERAHPGWLVVAVGCPTPVMDDNGTPSDSTDDRIISWHMPECPAFLGFKCRFDGSLI